MVVKDNLLDTLIGEFLPVRVQPGKLVEGTVISVQKKQILLDLFGVLTGSISGKEIKDNANTIKDLKVGDTVTAVVLEEENDDGFVVLSFRKASQEKTWQKFIDAYQNDKVIKVKPSEANKGGLLLDIDGIKGFIPVSQLAPLHYPRVNGADANQILTKLKELIGQELDVKIINLDKDNGKLILSEKSANDTERDTTLEGLNVGQKVKGHISGIVQFGIFVTFGQVEGLVHVSEIEWGHCKDTRNYGKVGDEVEVVVIGIEKGKISLSMKRMTQNPWEDIDTKFPLGSKVSGKVNKVTPFGVFIELSDQINGLIHVSELFPLDAAKKDPTDSFKVGDDISAWIIAVDTKEHRIALSTLESSLKKALEDAAKASTESEVVAE